MVCQLHPIFLPSLLPRWRVIIIGYCIIHTLSIRLWGEEKHNSYIHTYIISMYMYMYIKGLAYLACRIFKHAVTSATVVVHSSRYDGCRNCDEEGGKHVHTSSPLLV